ncbi:MAG: ATP-binding protein [Gracilimonas sp.]|uniref:two-component system sensor histidine kinase NtrB n=1 Tax=Gracilimonas sp. TaxID=1974203 RepID=UPI003753DA38|nr:ATP-binding protein [Gracilimonas sp.]
MNLTSSNPDPPTFRRAILRSVLLACGVVIALFGLFEITESFWLDDFTAEELQPFHLFRGIFIALVSVILVGWLVVKASDSLLSAQKWTLGERPNQRKRLEKFINWFIIMRWVAVFLALVLVYLVIFVYKWLPMEVWWPVIITIGCLGVFNVIFMILDRHHNFDRFLLPVQAYVDLVLLTILLHFSGGIENPFTFILLIHVLIAGILLSQKQFYAVTATAIILLIVMAAGEITGIFEHYTLTVFPHFEDYGTTVHASQKPLYVSSVVGLMATIFLLSAFFIDTIMSRIRSDEQQLALFADQSLEQRQLIEKSLETTKTGLLVSSKKGIPLWANLIWEIWFDQTFINGTVSDSASDEAGFIAKTLKDGKTRTNEITVNDTGHGNESRTFRITTAALLDKDGNYDRAVSLAMDITEQKEAQQQMLRAGKLAAVGELAGKIAHEVNNPITIISAKSRLLLFRRADEMSEKMKQEMIKIIDAADRVSDIAKGLLSYCRPSVAFRNKLDLCIPIQNALSMIEQTAQKNGISIENHLPDSLLPVMANADEMQQVFLNLFLNALDAMPEGGRLIIKADQPTNEGKEATGFLILWIQDTGDGIPQNIQNKIFEPFFTTKEKEHGTGLGLSICSGIIRSHEGSINVGSKPGQGTTFTIKIPTAPFQEGVKKNG